MQDQQQWQAPQQGTWAQQPPQQQPQPPLQQQQQQQQQQAASPYQQQQPTGQPHSDQPHGHVAVPQQQQQQQDEWFTGALPGAAPTAAGAGAGAGAGAQWQQAQQPSQHAAPGAGSGFAQPGMVHGGYDVPAPAAMGAGAAEGHFTSHGFNPPPAMSMGADFGTGAVGGGAGAIDFDNEPPLLEELGINFEHIWAKTLAVLVPTKSIDPDMLADTDMAGPVVFCLVQGFCLLFSGKLFFGYLFGFGVVGCVSIYLLINLMNHAGSTVIDIYRVFSVLGYCLLPIVMLSAVTVVFDLGKLAYVGTPITMLAIVWCTQTATRFFEAATQMNEQRFLIAYPVLLLYASFALITVF